MRLASILLLSGILSGATGCNDCDDPDYRIVSSRGQISATGIPREEFVQFTVDQRRDEATLASVTYSVTGVDLRFRIAEARLVEPGPNGRVLFELPVVQPISTPDAASGQLTDVVPAVGTVEHVFDLIMRNAVVLELVTDIPGRELIRPGLVVESGSDEWQSACGGFYPA